MLQRSIFYGFFIPVMPEFSFMDTPTLSATTTPPLQHRFGFLLSTGACALTTAITWPFHTVLDPVNTVMLFLLTVVLVATRWGRGPAVWAAFLSVGLFDFFYVPPRWSFAVSDIQYLLTFAVMLTVALIIGHLTIGLRLRADEAQQIAQRSDALYKLASRLAGSLSIEQVRDISAEFAKAQLHANLTLVTPASDDALLPSSSADRNHPPQADEALQRAIQVVYQERKAITSHQLSATGSVVAILPLTGSTRSRGVLVLRPIEHDEHTLVTQKPLMEAVASLIATSLERLHFVEVAHASQLEASAERLRNSILSALSHDIRTPLTSLYGLADAMTMMQPPLSVKAQEMVTAMRDQSMRLHNMVTNLLDMARLQSGMAAGQLPLRLEWQPIEEVIGASIQMLGTALAHHPVRVRLAPSLQLVHIDAVLMERVFANLLENASKYSPTNSTIEIFGDQADGQLIMRVQNAGAGFPPDKLHMVFDLFERGLTESNIPGMGLGLAICKAIVEAHGGHIWALNPASGGAMVQFDLPLGSPPWVEPEPMPEQIA